MIVFGPGIPIFLIPPSMVSRPLPEIQEFDVYYDDLVSTGVNGYGELQPPETKVSLCAEEYFDEPEVFHLLDITYDDSVDSENMNSVVTFFAEEKPLPEPQVGWYNLTEDAVESSVTFYAEVDCE